MSKEDELELEIEKLEQELEEKKKKLSDMIETVDVCFHGDYEHGEYAETYQNLSDDQIQELYDASYEVELRYNFKTHKFEIP